jgi:phosphoribosylformylglycinamidine (FGAM) synthase-like enzyme
MWLRFEAQHSMQTAFETAHHNMMTVGAFYCTLQPWEDAAWEYPESLASPQQILTDASNGASDYGNKFGEPVLAGYTRTFGMRLPNGERREWIKPIMFRHARMWSINCKRHLPQLLKMLAQV